MYKSRWMTIAGIGEALLELARSADFNLIIRIKTNGPLVGYLIVGCYQTSLPIYLTWF